MIDYCADISWAKPGVTVVRIAQPDRRLHIVKVTLGFATCEWRHPNQTLVGFCKRPREIHHVSELKPAF